MNFLEKNLEDIICESDRKSLADRGLKMGGILFRQLRIGNYGIADLITLSKVYNQYELDENNKVVPVPVITIYELKKGEVNLDTFMQATGYVKGVIRYCSYKNIFSNAIYRVVLIGSDVSYEDGLNLMGGIFPTNIDGSNFLSIYLYDYKIDGLHFENKPDFMLAEEGFKNE